MSRLPRWRLAPVLLAATWLGGWGRCATTASQAPTGPWELVWSDEFDGPAGQLPSAATWKAELGTGQNGWGNAELEYYTARPENASLDGQGRLAIVARREDYQGSAYTSARLITLGKQEWAYGKIEARLKLPSGQGIWPAFWLMGADIGAVGWPDCGEIDVMELRGQAPGTTYGTVHGPGYSGGSSIGNLFTLPGGARFDQDFHVFAVEWDPGRLVFSVDGTPYHTVTPASLPEGKAWAFDGPFFLLLNVAVGGNFVGPPDGSTTFPQTMLVDWVRVSQRGP